MSTGLVICSHCRREVHQTGDREVRRGWIHCVDQTPICEDATAAYPKTRMEIVGAYCAADGPAPAADEPEATMSHAVGRVTMDIRSRREPTQVDTSVRRPLLQTGVQTTEVAMSEKWRGDPGRLNKAKAFLKRAKKSDVRRRMEKRTRKKNRRK